MVAAIVLFQSQRAENALTGEDESAIRGLLELFGKNDSLGYFATRRDKAVVFAPNGRAAITYRVEVGVCLASGDPVGDPKAWQQAIRRVAGAVPDVRLGARGDGCQLDGRRGLPPGRPQRAATRRRGDPASGQLPALRSRHARGPAGGDAGAARRRTPFGSDATATSAATRWPEVIARADAWRDTETERGFSMALGPARRPGRRRLPAGRSGAERRGQRSVAMLSLVPWGNNGVSLDLMRRSPQSPNGTIELMVSELCMQSEGIGVTRISLNFAMFRSAFEQGAQLGAGPVARLWRGLLVFFSRWWQLETLYRSNMKYQPEWVPRYACYEDARLVPAGRRRVGDRRGLSGAAVLAAQRAAAHRTSHLRRRRTWSPRACCTTTAARPTSASCRPTCPRPMTSRGCPSRCACGWPSSRRCRTAASTPIPVGAGAEPHRRAGRRRQRRRPT